MLKIERKRKALGGYPIALRLQLLLPTILSMQYNNIDGNKLIGRRFLPSLQTDRSSKAPVVLKVYHLRYCYLCRSE